MIRIIQKIKKVPRGAGPGWRVILVSLVYLVYFVCLVYLVNLVFRIFLINLII